MIIVLFLLALVAFTSYLWSIRKFDYWKKKKVKYLEPTPFLGNYGPYILQQKSNGEALQMVCQKLPDAPIIGAFYGTEPVLIVQDPELVRLVLTKEFYYFNGREVSDHTHNEMLTKNMFFTYGDNWKVLRQNMTPLFSSAKMKNMFYLIEKCTKVFEKLLDEEMTISSTLEVRSLMARFTMDCVSSASFGIDTRAMSKDSGTNPFRHIADVIFDTSKIRGLKTVFRAVYPTLFYGLRLQLFPKEIHTFFRTVLQNVFKERRGMPVVRHDFVDLVNNLRNDEFIFGDSIKNMKGLGETKDKAKIKVDEDLLIAQCVLFFAAGFETSATTSSFTLYELAKKPDIQQRVLDEIDAYMKDRDEVQFDCTTELPFLDQCLDETLRLYPVIPVLTREVYEDYTLPNGVKVERGLPIHLPVYHLHKNPKFWENPEDYNPDRFSPEGKRKIVPYSYLPFGEGPRTCLGMRFAKMQMTAGIITLLKKYRVELGEGMPARVELEPAGLVIQSKTGIDLKLTPREGWQQRVFNTKTSQ